MSAKKKKIKKRLTRKERLRRKRISRSLRKYYAKKKFKRKTKRIIKKKTQKRLSRKRRKLKKEFNKKTTLVRAVGSFQEGGEDVYKINREVFYEDIPEELEPFIVKRVLSSIQSHKAFNRFYFRFFLIGHAADDDLDFEYTAGHIRDRGEWVRDDGQVVKEEARRFFDFLNDLLDPESSRHRTKYPYESITINKVAVAFRRQHGRKINAKSRRRTRKKV